MKNLSLIFILILLSVNVFSQNTFELTISSNNEERLNDLIELNDGSFIISGEIKNSDESNGYIIKISSTGEIINETIINIPDSNFVIQKITLDTMNNFFVYGYAGSKINGIYNMFIIRKYDFNFNLIFEKKYKVKSSESSIYRIRLYNKHNSNIVLYGFVSTNHDFPLEYFFFEITESGDSIHYNQYGTDGLMNLPFSLLEKKDNLGYFCYASRVNGGQSYAAIILKLDNKFNIVGYNGLSQDVNLIHNTGELKWVTDTSYIVCGTTYEFKKTQDNDLGIAILDTANHEIIKFNHSGKIDTIEMYGVYKCMEFSNEKEYIYTGGYGNYDFEMGSYGNKPTYYIFNKLDKNLNILKEVFYWNTTYNVLYFFKRTSDNGFIYLASSYNNEKPEKKLDAHIIKIDSEGNFPMSIENPKIKAHELIIYPNPSTTNLNIRTAVQRIGGEFIMYDITGKQIITQKITQAITTINTNNLPKGTYIYKYIYKAKEIESGKWIKQ